MGQCTLTDRTPLLYPKWDSRESLSTVKLIKSDRLSRLSEDTLDHLDGPPLAQWDATDAVHLWWRSKQRRQVQDTRVEPRPGTFNAENDPTTEYNTVPLELYYTTHMYCFKTYYDVINNWGDPERLSLHGTWTSECSQCQDKLCGCQAIFRIA